MRPFIPCGLPAAGWLIKIMKLKMTKHFQDMVQFRGLNLEHIKQALRDPDEKDNVFDGKIR